MRGELDGFCQELARARNPYRQVDGAELVRIAGTAARRCHRRRVRRQPHNLGAIARTAAFFGLGRIVLADCSAQALPSGAAYRVAEGGLEHLTLCRAQLPAASHELRQAYRLVGTSLAKGSVPEKRAAGRPVALILGNEETGLDAATLAVCDEVVRIPGSGQVQSLNVASAAAILIYLLTRS